MNRTRGPSSYLETMKIIVDVVVYSIVVFALAALILHLVQRPKRPTVVEFEKLEGTDAIVTLSNGHTLRGSGTVWHYWPSGERASTDIEVICSNEWTRQMWEIKS